MGGYTFSVHCRWCDGDVRHVTGGQSQVGSSKKPWPQHFPGLAQGNRAFAESSLDLIVFPGGQPLLEVPAGVQFGGQQRAEIRDNRRMTQTFTYNPPDGNRSPEPYVARVYTHRQNYFDFDYIPWTSTNRAVEAWKQNPGLFTQTLAQKVAQEIDRITNSQWFHENTTALYGQTDLRLLRELQRSARNGT